MLYTMYIVNKNVLFTYQKVTQKKIVVTFCCGQLDP